MALTLRFYLQKECKDEEDEQHHVSDTWKSDELTYRHTPHQNIHDIPNDTTGLYQIKHMTQKYNDQQHFIYLMLKGSSEYNFNKVNLSIVSRLFVFVWSVKPQDTIVVEQRRSGTNKTSAVLHSDGSLFSVI